MQKYFYIIFLVSSCLFGMEHEVDPLFLAISLKNAQLCTELWEEGVAVKEEHLLKAVDNGYVEVVAFLVSVDESLIQKINESIKKKGYRSKIDHRCYSTLVDMAL